MHFFAKVSLPIKISFLIFCFPDYSMELNVKGYKNFSLHVNEQVNRNHGDQSRKRNDERSQANGDDYTAYALKYSVLNGQKHLETNSIAVLRSLLTLCQMMFSCLLLSNRLCFPRRMLHGPLVTYTEF